MAIYNDETHLWKPNCTEEWLQLIWDIGHDYDGCNTVDGLKELIDELMEMNQEAMVCLRNGYLFPNYDDEEDMK